MRWFRECACRLLATFRSRRLDRDTETELQFHIDLETEAGVRRGLTRQERGGPPVCASGNWRVHVKKEPETTAVSLIDQFLQDLRYAARMILRNPTFTILAALSLALGIGANTAIYSFMDALLMQSLPVFDPESLVVLNLHVTGKKSFRDSVVHNVSGYFFDDAKTGKTTAIFPYPAFELLRNKSTGVLSVLFAYHPAEKLNVMIHGQAEVLNGEYVSGDYFRGLAVTPAAGRLIAGDDDRAGAPAVVMLSYALAQRRFGDAASAAGRPVLINNIPFTAIGVTPPGFFGVNPAAAPDFYVPMDPQPLLKPDRDPAANPAKRYLDEHYYWIEMMGRLQPGVTLAQARAALGPVFEQWVATTATNDQERKNLPEFLLKDGAGGLDNLRRKYSRPAYILLALVGLILAIACANIANLLLARATARRREIAVRLSIGAGRWRVVRQLLTESLLLASIGGAVGILFGIWGVRALMLLLTGGDTRFPARVDLNWHVLAAAALLTIVTGLSFGLAPALQAAQVDITPVLKETPAGERRFRARLGFSLSKMLVVSQVAISLLLLVAAGLFVRTLSNLRSLEMGFQRENVLVFTLDAGQAGHRDPEIIRFYSYLQKRFRAIPGVRSATVANSPLIGEDAWGWPVVPFGKQRPENAPSGRGSGAAPAATRVLATGPGFFTTMQIPMLAGREFDERDRLGAPPVAIVNEAWVKVNLERPNAVGQHVVSFGLRGKPQEIEIIGVAKNARYEELKGNFPAIVYMPFEQNLTVPAEDMTFFLRTAGDPLAFASTVRKIVHRADARIPVTNLRTQTAQIDQQMSQEILFARLCTGFAVLALTIACVGLYGTTSYTVARRTGEIGIRMALGAQRGTVIRLVLRDVLILATVGLAISVPLALGTAKFVESFLFGVNPNDPMALTAAVAILLSAALAAGYAPARRASRIDPMIAVRHE